MWSSTNASRVNELLSAGNGIQMTMGLLVSRLLAYLVSRLLARDKGKGDA